MEKSITVIYLQTQEFTNLRSQETKILIYSERSTQNSILSERSTGTAWKKSILSGWKPDATLMNSRKYSKEIRKDSGPHLKTLHFNLNQEAKNMNTLRSSKTKMKSKRGESF